MAKIETQNLNLFYGKKHILTDISCTLKSGEILVLIGANGAGKSSLMKTMLGLLRPSSGTIKIDGEDLKQIKPLKRAIEIGYLGQNIVPEFNMSVYDLVALGRIPHQEAGITTQNQDKEAIEKALLKLEIQFLRHSKINEISGGELALALLARVLAGEPKFIFADEPLNHLDIVHQLKLLAALKDFAKSGGGVLSIIHDLNFASLLGDKFLSLSCGNMVAHGNKDQVLNAETLEKTFHIDFDVQNFDTQTIYFPKMPR